MGPCRSALAVRLPTSRAYWNLRAEQVMDKVFDQDALHSSRPNHLIPVDVDVHEPPPPTPPAPAKPTPNPAATSTTPWLLLIVSGIAVAGAVNSGWLISSLLMLERLQAEASTPAEPEPEWMASLEPPAPPSRPEVALSPVAPEPLPIPTLTPMPQLTGVVQGPGGNSSAIFQLGTTSLSAGIGESIGSSGWRLDSINSGGAVISQHGQQRTLSVGGLF